MLALLKNIKEPATGEGLVSGGLVKVLESGVDSAIIELGWISPLYPHQKVLEGEIHKVLNGHGITQLEFIQKLAIPGDGRMRQGGFEKVRNAIAIASGKGGVGKSTLSVNIASALAKAGARVGLLDADIYGPNIPTMMGLQQNGMQADEDGRMIPLEAMGIKVVSVGFLTQPGQPIIWRGPLLHSTIEQFTKNTAWGELDYLIIDLPPGTGDVQLSLAQTAALSGGVIITLPQKVSQEDAVRGLEMFRKLNIPILGLVENMSYLPLPDGNKMDLFGEGGGKQMAEEQNIPFLGALPIDAAVRQGGDSGMPIVTTAADTEAAQAFMAIAGEVALASAREAYAARSQLVSFKID